MDGLDCQPHVFFFFFFLFHKSTAQVLLLPCPWDWWGKKRTMDTTSPLLTSNTLLQSWTWCIIFNIIKERKLYWKRYPSECGRALKYVTCKGKNWCSIIPKRDAEKRQLLQRPNPNILPTILPKAPKILCRSDNMYNRKRTSQITGHFSKQIPTPTHTQHKKNNKPNPDPSLPNPTSKQTCTHTHIHTPSHTSQFKTT